MIPNRFVKPCGLLISFLVVINGCIPSPTGSKVSAFDLKQALRPVVTQTAYAGFDGLRRQFYVGNALIERRFQLSADNSQLQTIFIVDKSTGEYYVNQLSEEFWFEISGQRFSGLNSQFHYQKYKIDLSFDGSRLLRLWMRYQRPVTSPLIDDFSTVFENPFPEAKTMNLCFSIQICYRIYPHQARIDKWLVFENQGNTPFDLEEICVESLPIFHPSRSALICRKLVSCHYGQYLEISPTIGPVNRLVSIVNQAPGPFKAIDLYEKQDSVSAGIKTFDSQVPVIITAWPSQSVVIPSVSFWFGQFIDGLAAKSSLSYLDTEDLANYQILDFENEVTSVLLDQFSDPLMSKPKAIRLPIATVGEQFLDQPDWLHSSVTESDRPIYCLLSEYGHFFRKAVDDLLSHYPVSLLILSGPIFEKDNNELKGCANIRHGHAAPSESTFLTYNWLFEFSMYIRQRHPNVKLGITAKTYGVDQPDYACWQHFDFFVP